MHSTSIVFGAVLATLAAAMPAPFAVDPRSTGDSPSGTYYSVGLSGKVSSGMTPDAQATWEPIPAQLNTLIQVPNFSCSALRFDGTASNIDYNTVECRAFKDADGVVPGSAPFTASNPAELSTNLVEINSIICYVVSK
ncbi:hypothetical protein H2203_006469 [Taxawa tesnikishii (nom. ined.)]|nr:hypothetical protein H2203_006469 [Dothideales sp. JES 119]